MGSGCSAKAASSVHPCVHQEVAPGHLAADTLEMFIIVHRHGARFPNKCLPGDLSWPSLPAFWTSYKGHLSPKGALQHYRLGEKLAKRYRKGSQLLSSLSPQELQQAVFCQTSPVQRCLLSAWSLLDGLFPEIPRYFFYDEETREVPAKEREAMGIAITVEDASKQTDKVFHQLEFSGEEAQQFRKRECLKCEQLQTLAGDPSVMALADRLYQATGDKALAPKSNPVERIAKFKSIMTQIMISKAHGLPILPNKDAVHLSAAEQELVSRVSRQVMRHAFRPVQSNEVADGIGREAAGVLGNEIGRLLGARMAGHSPVRMAEFSCHDGNILALASLLGLDVEPPEFSSHWLFELHRPSTKHGEWTARVFFVRDPEVVDEQAYCALQPRQVPLDGVYVEMEQCPVGPVSAQKLVGYLKEWGVEKPLRTETV